MSNEKDLFAPPTDQEKNLFALPSADELKLLNTNSPQENVSKLYSGLGGAAQSATLGFADETLAGIFTAIDALTGGEAAKNIAKENEALGTNLTPYQVAREVSREDFLNAEKANPEYYAGGGLAAGIASAPLLGVAKTVGGAAKIGAGLGALGGLGAGDADLTKNEYGKAALQTGIGAALGGGLGALSQAAPKSTIAGALGGGGLGAYLAEEGKTLEGGITGAGIGAGVAGTLGLTPNIVPGLANKLGGTVTRNYQFAKETGENVFDKTTAQKLAKKYDDLVKKVKNPFVKKQEQIQAGIKNTEREVENLSSLESKRVDLDNEFNIAQTEKNKEYLAVEREKIAKGFQSDFAKAFSGIKKNYDKIEKEIPDDFFMNIYPAVENFKEIAAFASPGLAADDFFAKGRFKDFNLERMTNKQFQTFRSEIERLKKVSPGTVSPAFSGLLTDINNIRTSSISNSSIGSEIGQQLAVNDKFYAKAMQLQDSHLGSIDILNKETADYLSSNKVKGGVNTELQGLMKTYLDLSKDSATKGREFLKDLYDFNPELAQKFQNEMSGYVKKQNSLLAKPAVISKDEALLQNAEYQKMQQLLEDYKNPKIESTSAEKLVYSKNPADIETPLRGKLKDLNDAVPESTEAQYLDSVLSQYKNMTGKDITPEAKKVVEGYRLSNVEQIDPNLPRVSYNPIQQASNILESAGNRGAAAYGRLENKMSKRTDYINKKLDAVKDSTSQERSAVIFGLLQQPEFREILNKNKDTEKKETEK